MMAEDDETSMPFTNVTPEEAHKMIAEGALVVDVRQPEEWIRGHIPEAELVPLDGIYLFGKAIVEYPQNRDMILVCELGQRSMVAAEIALVAGHARVYNLVGGMASWRMHKLPLAR
jgi:rhodanese-related sulfurtransferase